MRHSASQSLGRLVKTNTFAPGRGSDELEKCLRQHEGRLRSWLDKKLSAQEAVTSRLAAQLDEFVRALSSDEEKALSLASLQDDYQPFGEVVKNELEKQEWQDGEPSVACDSHQLAAAADAADDDGSGVSCDNNHPKPQPPPRHNPPPPPPRSAEVGDVGASNWAEDTKLRGDWDMGSMTTATETPNIQSLEFGKADLAFPNISGFAAKLVAASASNRQINDQSVSGFPQHDLFTSEDSGDVYCSFRDGGYGLDTVRAVGSGRDEVEIFFGDWIDKSGNFMGGAVIHISADGWYPIQNRNDNVDGVTYARKMLIGGQMELSERTALGTKRTYLLQHSAQTRGMEDVMQVHEGTPTGGMQWMLHRVEKRVRRFELYDAWMHAGFLTEAATVDVGQASENLDVAATRTARHSWRSSSLDSSQLNHRETWWAQTADHINVTLMRFMWRPASTSRVLWDVIGLTLILIDFVLVPLEFLNIQGPEDSKLRMALELIALVFWSVDVPLLFFTGFVNTEGETENRFTWIASRYLKTWFTLDFCLVMADVLALSNVTDGLHAAASARLLRMARFFRLLKLVRLYRFITLLPQMIDTIGFKIESETLKIVFDISALVFCVTAFTHIVACMWFGLGQHNAESGIGWVHVHNVADLPKSHQYAVAYHWALTQIAGSTDINPNGAAERYFAIAVLHFGFVASAFVVSAITTNLTQLVLINSKYSKQRQKLHEYLQYHSVDARFAARVQRRARTVQEEHKKHIQQGEVELLNLLSAPLLLELSYKIMSPVVLHHPFFIAYGKQSWSAIRQLCKVAMEEHRFHSHDLVFCGGEMEATPRMYFVMNGSLKYEHILSGKETVLSRSCWAAESSLWTRWEHRGNLMATTTCTLVQLDVENFQGVTSQFALLTKYVVHYASLYLIALESLPILALTDLPDSNLDHSAFLDISFRRVSTFDSFESR